MQRKAANERAEAEARRQRITAAAARAANRIPRPMPRQRVAPGEQAHASSPERQPTDDDGEDSAEVAASALDSSGSEGGGGTDSSASADSDKGSPAASEAEGCPLADNSGETDSSNADSSDGDSHSARRRSHRAPSGKARRLVGRKRPLPLTSSDAADPGAAAPRGQAARSTAAGSVPAAASSSLAFEAAHPKAVASRLPEPVAAMDSQVAAELLSNLQQSDRPSVRTPAAARQRSDSPPARHSARAAVTRRDAQQDIVEAAKSVAPPPLAAAPPLLAAAADAAPTSPASRARASGRLAAQAAPGGPPTDTPAEPARVEAPAARPQQCMPAACPATAAGKAPAPTPPSAAARTAMKTPAARRDSTATAATPAWWVPSMTASGTERRDNAAGLFSSGRARDGGRGLLQNPDTPAAVRLPDSGEALFACLPGGSGSSAECGSPTAAAATAGPGGSWKTPAAASQPASQLASQPGRRRSAVTPAFLRLTGVASLKTPKARLCRPCTRN